MHWELLMAVKAREDGYLAERHAAATKIAALWRGHVIREDMDDMWNESLFTVEYGTYQEEGHDWVAEVHGHVWANMCKQYVIDGVKSYSELYELQDMTAPDVLIDSDTDSVIVEQVMQDITNQYGVSVMQFGPEYSSDNAGDGPFGAILVVLVLVLDKLSSMRGRLGQWRAKDLALRQMSHRYPVTFWVVCTVIRHKLNRPYYAEAGRQLGKAFRSNNAGDGPGDEFDLPEFFMSVDEQVLFWIGLAEILTIEQTCALVCGSRNAVCQAYSRLKKQGKVERIAKGTYMFGPAYSSDNAGDGPITEEERVELATLDATLFMGRYEVVVEAFDLQVWTYGMRIYEHEYLGMNFDHHRDFGSQEMMRDLDALRELFNIWLRSDDHNFISLPKWLWSKCISHLETLEMAEFFHDERMEESLRALIRDMILLRADPNHFLLPRPESSKHNFVPLF